MARAASQGTRRGPKTLVDAMTHLISGASEAARPASKRALKELTKLSA
jgi:hypothetical protein